METTTEVSLADVSLASIDALGGAMVATDRTEDISLHDVELASLEAANDAKPTTTQELIASASDPSHSAPDLAPRGHGKRWLWGVGALLLLGGSFVALRTLPVSDAGKSDYPLVGDPGAAHSRVPASAAAAATSQAALPVEPEKAPAAAVGEAASLPAVADDNAEVALAAAQPSVGAAGSAPDDETAEGSADLPEVAAENQEQLDAALAVALKRADSLVAQASALRKRRKFEPARSKYRAALDLYPGHARALYGLVQVAIQQHDGKQAVQFAQELVQAKPEQLSYLVLLGDAYKAAGKPKDAREAWQSAARQGNTVARKRLK
jgi:hypothetical protein